MYVILKWKSINILKYGPLVVIVSMLGRDPSDWCALSQGPNMVTSSSKWHDNYSLKYIFFIVTEKLFVSFDIIFYHYFNKKFFSLSSFIRLKLCSCYLMVCYETNKYITITLWHCSTVHCIAMQCTAVPCSVVESSLGEHYHQYLWSLSLSSTLPAIPLCMRKHLSNDQTFGKIAYRRPLNFMKCAGDSSMLS